MPFICFLILILKRTGGEGSKGKRNLENNRTYAGVVFMGHVILYYEIIGKNKSSTLRVYDLA